MLPNDLQHVLALTGAHGVIRSKLFFFTFLGDFYSGVCWDRGFDSDFNQGLTIFFHEVRKLKLP